MFTRYRTLRRAVRLARVAPVVFLVATGAAGVASGAAGMATGDAIYGLAACCCAASAWVQVACMIVGDVLEDRP